MEKIKGLAQGSWMGSTAASDEGRMLRPKRRCLRPKKIYYMIITLLNKRMYKTYQVSKRWTNTNMISLSERICISGRKSQSAWALDISHDQRACGQAQRLRDARIGKLRQKQTIINMSMLLYKQLW